MLFRRVIECSGGLHAVQGGYMDPFLLVDYRDLFRRVVRCSGGLYAVQEGYMLFRRAIWMFRRVIC